MKIADVNKVFCEDCGEFTEFEIIKEQAIIDRLIQELNESVETYTVSRVDVRNSPEFQREISEYPATAKRCALAGCEFLTFEVPSLAFTQILGSSIETRLRLLELKKTGRLFDAAESEVQRRRDEAEKRVKEAETRPTVVQEAIAAVDSSPVPTLDQAKIAVFGSTSLRRQDAVGKFWTYVKMNDLQDKVNSRLINADRNLLTILGKEKISMFELGQILMKHFPG